MILHQQIRIRRILIYKIRIRLRHIPIFVILLILMLHVGRIASSVVHVFEEVAYDGTEFVLCCRCEIVDFHKACGANNTHPLLMQWVKDYFQKGQGKFLPPLYLQHQGS